MLSTVTSMMRAVLSLMVALSALPVLAQDNYEIQVYGVDTVEPRTTMVELHSNVAVEGTRSVENGVQPTEHAVHETVEIHGAHQRQGLAFSPNAKISFDLSEVVSGGLESRACGSPRDGLHQRGAVSGSTVRRVVNHAASRAGG